MGNCATKPKVLRDTDEDLIPVERETTAPTDHNNHPVEKSVNNAPSAAARWCEKGKEILIEDDVEEEHSKRQSLSHLFHEDKAIEKEITNLSRIKNGASSEASKLDTFPLVDSHVKAPETFDVQNRNNLEVKLPKYSKVKTPVTPKAKEAEDRETNFSENWEVKFPEELEVVKVSEETKVPQVSKVTKGPDVPEVLEVKNVQEVSEVPIPSELSEIKVAKESGDLDVLENKNAPEVPKVMNDEVKATESELLKVSEDLETEVQKVFEVKTPETLSVGSEIKIDQDTTKVKTTEETKVSEFVDAQEKIHKSESQILEDTKVTEDKRKIVKLKTKEGGKRYTI